jgi:REP element-mobilizing transposase RayT
MDTANNRKGNKSPQLLLKKRKDITAYRYITITTFKRVQIFAYREIARIAMEVILFYQRKGDLCLHGFIVMPDHIHLICSPGKVISHLVEDIKKCIAQMAVSHLSAADKDMLLSMQPSNPKKKERIYQLWEKDFFDSLVRGEGNLGKKLRYMYENPVRKGMCGTIVDYEFSDSSRYFGPWMRDHSEWINVFHTQNKSEPAIEKY